MSKHFTLPQPKRTPGTCPWSPKLEVIGLSYFEQFVTEQGIPEEEWADSIKVQAFVRKHHKNHYIPEQLLSPQQRNG